jgi:flagellar motor switch protein FliM
VPRLLSQEEIDALLTQVSTEEPAEAKRRTTKGGKKAQFYDFKRPDRLSKENIRSLHLIHERFARSFSSSLSAYLRTMCEVNIISVDQFTYFEFLMSLPDPTCFSVLSMSPLEGSSALEINPSIVFPIIDKLMGGPGQPLAEVREITDIEYKIIEGVISQALADLEEAWAQAVEVKFKVIQRETSPQLIQIAAPNEPVVLITLEVKIADMSGMMNLCIPSTILEPVCDRFTQDWYSVASKNRAPELDAWIGELLHNVRLPMTVSLGRTTLTVRDLRELEVGDVVVLPNQAHSPLTVSVVGIPKFEASIGEHQSKRAVRVLWRLERTKMPPTASQGRQGSADKDRTTAQTQRQ